MYDQKPLPRFVLSEYLGWRSETQMGVAMNFWEQMGLTIFATILSELHFNPAKLGLLTKILVPIRDTLNLLYPPSVTLTSTVAPPK